MLGYDQPLSFREYCLLREYRLTDLQSPEREDYYAMRIVQRIDGIFGKAKSDLSHYEIPFKSKGEPELSAEEATKLSKARWGFK